MTQVQNDLLTIKAYGRAAEHKLKGLLSLTRSEVKRLPRQRVAMVNAVCKYLAKGFDESDYGGNPKSFGYVEKEMRVKKCG